MNFTLVCEVSTENAVTALTDAMSNLPSITTLMPPPSILLCLGLAVLRAGGIE